MNVFDVLDPGLSQSRGLTLFEYCNALYGQILTPKILAQSNCNHDLKGIPTSAIQGEKIDALKSMIDEAIRCLASELDESIGGRARKRLIEMDNTVTQG